MTLRYAPPRLLTLACALLLCACGEPPRAEVPTELTWFSIGGDRYRLSEARAAQTEVLRLEEWPRWFVGPAELVSIAEIERQRAARGVVVEEARAEESSAPPGMRWVGTVPTRPRRLTDLPLSQTGARLELTLTASKTAGELTLTLILHAGVRALFRESEHRSTNVLPFLFTLAVDGQPIRVPMDCAAHFGGSADFQQLVEPGATRSWTLRVDAASLRAHATGAMTIAALFSERQHTGWAALDGEVPGLDLSLEPPFEGEPVMIRSDAVPIPATR